MNHLGRAALVVLSGLAGGLAMVLLVSIVGGGARWTADNLREVPRGLTARFRSELQPCWWTGDMDPVRQALRTRIQSTLGSGRVLPHRQGGPQLATNTVVIPAYRREWAVGVLVGPGERAVVVGVTPRMSIREANLRRTWGPIDDDAIHFVWRVLVEIPARVEVDERRVSIDPHLALQLKELFEDSVLAVRRPSPPDRIYVLDGTTYEFSTLTPEGEFACAWTWSPDPETTAGFLVEVSTALSEAVFTDESKRPARIERLERLLAAR